jgi:hypothetical protein
MHPHAAASWIRAAHAVTVAIITLGVACGGGSSTPDAPHADAPRDTAAPTDAPAADATPIDAGCPTTWAVDGATGSDTAAGTCLAPFKTITHALSVATTGQSIHVAPGAYDAAHGETLPIAIPAGVALLGDEAHLGAGATPTTITGHATVRTPSYYNTTLTLGAGATIAGFHVINDDPLPADVSAELWLYGENDGTVRANTLTGGSYGLIFDNATTGTVVTGNTITTHFYVGLLFSAGGVGAKVEGNTLTGNLHGVEYDSAGGDLGGGATGSAGNNTIACNTEFDVWTNTPAITITAKNNRWDHVPPTSSATTPATTDIYNGQSVPLDTTGATLAAAPCP